MNERIHEIALDCYEWVGGNEDGDVRIFDYEKFAELLINECIGVMSKTAAEDRFTYVGDDIPTTVHQFEIKQHFGIK